MATAITTTMRVVESGGSTTSATANLSVEAFSRTEVTVPGGGSASVDVNPGTDALQLLFITADDYPTDAGTGAAELTFTVTNTEAPMSVGPVGLDAPVLLVGNAVAVLLGDVNEITFANALDPGEDVDVQILVGRAADVTP